MNSSKGERIVQDLEDWNVYKKTQLLELRKSYDKIP